MADVMLVNPSSEAILENAGDRPPLGLLYIGTALQDRGHNVDVVDLDHTSLEALCDRVNNKKYDVIGVSAYTSVLYPQAANLGIALSGKAKTVVGGYHATAMPETLKDHYDVVVVGEGEQAMIDVVEKGLTGIVQGQKMNVKDIPIPNRDLVDMDDYQFQQNGKSATTLMSSRGCPNACVFCGNMNRSMRYFSDEHVMAEVEDLKARGFDNLYFYDDAFLINKKRSMSLIKKLGEAGVEYRITARARSVDEEVAKALGENGCKIASIGVESGVNERLKDIHKNMTTEDNRNAVKLLSKYGVQTKGFFCVGLPNESESNVRETIEFAKELKAEGMSSADFYIMTPFPGTPLWEHPEQYGIKIRDRDFTKYIEAGKGPITAFHSNSFMTPETIQSLRDTAEEEFKNA